MASWSCSVAGGVLDFAQRCTTRMATVRVTSRLWDSHIRRAHPVEENDPQSEVRLRSRFSDPASLFTPDHPFPAPLFVSPDFPKG